MSRLRATRVAVFALAAQLVGSAGARAYLPTPFREAARRAPIVVLAGVVESRPGFEQFRVLRVIRGKAFKKQIAIAPPRLFDAGPVAGRPTLGTVYLLLLTEKNEPFWDFNLCGTTNAVPVARGELTDLERFDQALVQGGKLSLREAERLLTKDQEAK